MKRLKIWGRELEAQGSPYTYLVFKDEFGGDLGAQLARAYAGDGESYDIEEFLRIIWAMCKTASDDVEDYERWLEQWPLEKFTVLEGVEQLAVMMDAIEAELFRGRQTLSRRLRRRVAAGLLALL